MLLREARERIEGGEAGKEVRWYRWAGENIKVKRAQLYLLLRIAEAPDPRHEYIRQLRLTQRRVEKHREKKAAEERQMEPERKDLIAWAKNAPIEQVRRVCKQVTGAASTVAMGSAGESSAPKGQRAA